MVYGKVKNYNMSFTTGGLLERETIIFANMFLQTNDLEKTCQQIKDENLFQYRTVTATKRILSELKSRFRFLDNEALTSTDENSLEVQEDNFAKIKTSCFAMGIKFSYKFEASIHARSIVTDTGWKISLDRGLDIYQQCDRKDFFAFTTRLQKYRPCRQFEVTYIKQEV